jgi:hypothetical protein
MTDKSGGPIVLSSNPSKADEMEWLDQVVSEIPCGTYLASLFSPELIKWFKRSVADDGSCDVMAAWNSQVKAVMANGQTMWGNANNELNKAREALDDCREMAGRDTDSLKAQLEQAQETIWAQRVAEDHQSQARENLEAEVNTWRAFAGELEQMAAQAWLKDTAIEPEELKRVVAGQRKWLAEELAKIENERIPF